VTGQKTIFFRADCLNLLPLTPHRSLYASPWHRGAIDKEITRISTNIVEKRPKNSETVETIEIFLLKAKKAVKNPLVIINSLENRPKNG
jgi:hypothetical protein